MLIKFDEVQKKQLNKLINIKENRNNKTVKSKLESITYAAAHNENVMPHIIDAALENATLGEIVDSMKVVFGEWVEKTSI